MRVHECWGAEVDFASIWLEVKEHQGGQSWGDLGKVVRQMAWHGGIFHSLGYNCAAGKIMMLVLC